MNDGLKADPGFVHLNVRSSFSLLEGALTIAKLASASKADGRPAIALTDDNLFGALEFSEKLSGSGVQPIVGLTLAIDFKDREQRTGRPARDPRRPSIVLLARSETGYRNLMALSSRAFLDGDPDGSPHATLAMLDGRCDGLIALTGGPEGPIDGAFADGTDDIAAARLGRLADLFGDALYVELQRHDVAREKAVEGALVGLAYDRGLPIVATNGARFAERGDYEAHDALICLADGRFLAESDRRQMTPEHYLKTGAEMAALFADLPEALENTVEIARRSAYRPRTAKPILPRFTVGAGSGDDSAEEAFELRRQAMAGLEARLAAHGPAPGLDVATYTDRLEFELGVIERMKYPGYFLIVADFIKWAKAQGIPVGPGRGSGAGSLVAYALTVTDLDPLRFGLLFERFLNPERVSMPDFDIDFCQDRREEVIRYVQRRYGEDRVAQIITFGTLQARGVMRDVGRVLEMPYGQIDKLCKLVPQNPANPVTLKQAVGDEPKLAEARAGDPAVSRMLDIALKLEGLYRHASTHAAGIVIGDRPLMELVPLYRDPRSEMPVTQFNMKWVEPAGLVKFDFLGLKTLTTLTGAVALLKKRGITLDLESIPIDDKATYDMLARGETVGVFQLESAGMRRALADMKPDRFEDIIALVALYRPGPMANIPTYCARKHGHEKSEYLHPKLEPILSETFGVVIYQEQVMQVAQTLAGYSLGEADLLRRAMGKKIRSEMDAQRERFVSGAVERGIGKADSATIFELLAKFADYGFNKSHAAAYALVAYQTAYLKANYPVEFLAASMTLDMGSTDKLAEFRQEAMRLGIAVKPPCVNRSSVSFDVEEGAILYALAALKGVGGQAVEGVVASRRERPFKDLRDFARRLDVKALPRRALESLVQAGALDALEPERARALASVDAVMAIASRTKGDEAVGQFGFFEAVEEPIRAQPHEPWPAGERLKREYEAVGFFLSGHPLDDYRDLLEKLRVRRYAEFAAAAKAGATAGRLAATVLTRQERKTKSGNRMGILTLSDPTGHYEAIIFSEGLASYRDLLEPNTPVIVTVAAAMEGEELRIRIEHVEPLDKAAEKMQRSVRIFMRAPEAFEAVSRRLESGDGEVSVVLMLDEEETEVEIRLPGRYRVSPQIAGALKTAPGVVAVEAA
ncbi:DNA polymerase III subunit alpha [Hansschlegelia plantiphila]|uniref:DNA polymerase III subunit alpha n=1 Tax=Hansschlegelia plantiphila TaxID=374655 RepID=A0A9W6J500_9HYPH|nr:DNA polymerase III subunit alpha [Hansschlegelia plantiphila]GLK69509.1 DNA-directed DNA polymerase [Hansschlegelia plantiphila]